MDFEITFESQSLLTHEQVHPSKVEPHDIQQNGEQPHENTEADDDYSRDPEDLLARGFGVEVFAVNIVGDQGRHGDTLGRSWVGAEWGERRKGG